MSDWQIETTPPPGEALVLNEDSKTIVGEFDSYGTADAWIADTNDHQERVGLPKPAYSIIPVRATQGGRDIR